MSTKSLECVECVEAVTFENEDHLRGHISLEHVFWIPFECVLCPSTLLPTETVLKRHYDQVHPDNVPKAIYTYEEKKKQELERILILSKTSVSDRLTTEPDPSEASNCPNQSQKEKAVVEIPELLPEITILADNNRQAQSELGNGSVTGDSPVVMQEEKKKQKFETKKVKAPTSTETAAPKPIVDVEMVPNECIDAKDTMDCRLCGEQVRSGAHKRHIWRHHLSLAPIECQLCNWKYCKNDKKVQERHILRAHPEAKGTPLAQSFKDIRQKLSVKFASQLALAFPKTETYLKPPQTSSSVSTTSDKTVTVTSVNSMERIDQFASTTDVNAKVSLHKTGTETKHQCFICQHLVYGKHRSNHVWQHHMTVKRLSCDICDYTCYRPELMKGHAKQKHNRNGQCWTDKMVELQNDYRCVYDRAFTESLQDSSDIATAKTIATTLAVESSPPLKTPPTIDSLRITVGVQRCKLCQRSVPVVESLRCNHIWQHHIFTKRYGCAVCDYRTISLKLMKTHTTGSHAQSVSCWTDKMADLHETYKLIFIRAFGQSPLDSNEQIDTTRKNRHIWQKDVEKKRYACNRCVYTCTLSTTMKYHVTSRHKSASFAHSFTYTF